jgi:hypothetical protein
MTKDAEYQTHATAPKPAPDRLKGLMDAAREHSQIATYTRGIKLQWDAADTASTVGKLIGDSLDAAVETECQALDAVTSWAHALLADKTLEDCRVFLVNRDQFRASVERAKPERIGSKDAGLLAELRDRLYGRRKTAPAPSPTR